MARIEDTFTIQVGSDGQVILRRPTNEEDAQYTADKTPRGNENALTAANRARYALFDRIVSEIANIEDKVGPITLERIADIPNSKKAEWIILAIDMGSGDKLVTDSKN